MDPVIRPARDDELVLLPVIERAADALFGALDIGPLPGPGTVEEFAGALVVLVAGDPPVGLCRIDAVGARTGTGTGAGAGAGAGTGTGAHLEQLSVRPDQGRRGIGRALLRAALEWARSAGYDELTLATYRDVPWNGPFYATEGFSEVGPADEWLLAHGLPPEEPVLGEGGTRIVMRRLL